MKTISIESLCPILNRTDLRSIRNWCKKNDVLIIKQSGSEFVFESEFREVFERPFINKLKQKFGKDWESVYRLYADGNIPALNTLHQISTVTQKAYQPDNSVVKEYLSKFKKHDTKKAA